MGNTVAIERLQMQIDEAISEGARLGGKHRSDLERLVDDHAAKFGEEVLAEVDAEQLKL